MQDVGLVDAAPLQMLEHILEIPRVRLVGADFLGGVNGIEFDTELFVTCGKAFSIDVRQNHQLVVLL